MALDYMSIPTGLPQDLETKVLRIEDRPADSNSTEHPDSTRFIETQWASALSTAVLVVPSAVLPLELNYPLDPRHVDFLRIQFHDT